LKDVGYREQDNIEVLFRSADDDWTRLPALVGELLAARVAVIVTAEGPAAVTTKKLTRTVPIVMAQSGDPVGIGLAASLARPGGNVTGLTTVSNELPTKQVQLLKEAIPGLSRLGVLNNPDNPGGPSALKHTTTAARALSLPMIVQNVRDAAALRDAFATFASGRADGLIVLPDPMFLTQRSRVAGLALEFRVPAIYGIGEHVHAGGLMSYAADRTVLFRRAAVYVDKILHGARPGDLPIEQPSQFELAINLKAAKALGLVIPQPLLLRADEVIQ